MNEESDGINENENNNSEVVILPERSHVEELLLSDQSQLREQNAYERKLDEKLKDLGLYEDDMTINQKEELLAVVVISCETAEQEENKRQLIREYLEGAQSLEEEIEFSFQESAWLAGEANLLCSSTITRPKDDDSDNSPSAKISSFLDGEASTSRRKNEIYDSLSEKSLSRNSPDIFQDETAYAEAPGEPQPSTSESHPKKSEFNRNRTRQGRKSGQSDDALKIGITHPMVQGQNADKFETTEILDRQLSFQRQKLLLDKSMGCWKPCMSPKDKCLSDFRLKEKKEENVSAASLQEKYNKYLAAFEKMASSLKSKRPPAPKVTLLSKPYVLMHHGSVAKKSSKLDNYDYMIGVSEKSQSNEESEEKFIPCNTLTRAKSAFHRVKPISHGKLVSFSDQNPESDTTAKVTRSGVSYGGTKRLKSDQENRQSSPEVILDDSLNQSLSQSKDNSNFVPEKHVTFQEDMLDDSSKKLPNFSNLRPDVTKCKMIVPSPILQKDSSQTDGVKVNCDSYSNSTEKRGKKREGIVENRSDKDDSSDSSSPLIDVETIVEDEVEDFVLKKKLTPGNKSTYNKNPGPSKRLKRNES